MLKGKKTAEVRDENGAIVLNANKEVDFGNFALKIAKPTLAEDKTLIIAGNFEEVGSKIQCLVDKYKNEQLTEANVNYIKTLKGQFASLRIGVERERTEYKKAYITPASKLIDSMCEELQKVIAEGEQSLGKQLEEYDLKRKEELTIILKEYVADSVAKHNLREEYASQIKLIDKYYNKTQHEEDSADDIEKQACELEKKQKEYDSGVKLIEAECNEAGFLADSYIRDLQYKSAMEIILEIKSDKVKAAEVKKSVEEGEKITIGEPISEELKKAMDLDSKEDTRTRVLRVTYRADQAKLMSKFFKENNIGYEFIKTDF